ncbi:hypothetical protein [Pseudovibrio denitrificans]|uniref:hypothetical protein n=1 Tax=Pseudovibrio denitrificans TaxID=258256 RepID=UPI000B062EB9|nr:hypothetical protein [Pseudovibrio denitrificans]
MIRFVALLVSHTVVLAVGFALGVYFLPILTAPDSPETAVLEQEAQNAQYTAEFSRDQRGSDFLHWGEGKVSVSPTMIVHQAVLLRGLITRFTWFMSSLSTKMSFCRSKATLF